MCIKWKKKDVTIGARRSSIHITSVNYYNLNTATRLWLMQNLKPKFKTGDKSTANRSLSYFTA
jgi:hypothetical protein